MKKKGYKKTRKERKRLFMITIVFISLLVFLGYTVYNDFILISKNKNSIDSLSIQYENLLNEKDALKSEVTKMQDPEYIARFAKEKYLYSSSGEIILKED